MLVDRLTKFITPVGKCMTTLNSMKHYMPCVPCRHNAQIKTDSTGKQYTEKFSFCDTCEVKMLFNRLKEYEDAEEQGLLIRLPCKVGTPVYDIKWWDDKKEKVSVDGKLYYRTVHKYKVSKSHFSLYDFDDIGKTVFLTKEEAERALKGGAE